MFYINIPKKYKSLVLYVLNDRIYRWSGWFGCQLESYEWKLLPAGTKRSLQIQDSFFLFTVFTTKRVGLRVKTTWTLNLNGSLDEQNKKINRLKNALRSLT